MSTAPLKLLSALLSLLLFISASSHAVVVCSDSGHDQIFNGPLDGICAVGSLEYQDITEIRALRQRVAESMAQEYGGQCRDIHGEIGRVSILACTKKKCPDCLGTFYVINYPLRTFGMPLYYVSDEPQRPAACEADPCDPASGMVLLSQTDIHDHGHGLSFTRYYRSHVTNPTDARLGVNWRHNYVSQLDARPDQITQHRLPANYSSYYASREEACLAGGETLKSTLYSGKLANAALSYTDNTCALSLNGRIVARLPIKIVDKQRPVSTAAVAHDILRPNGESYHFVDNKGVWESMENLPLQLQQDGTTWRLTLPDQRVEIYAADGHLIQSTSQDNKTTSYSYQNGVLQSVTGPFGHTLTFSYTDGRLSGVTGPDGTLTYAYDLYGNLIQVTYPDNSTRRYLYDDFNHISSLTGVIDENGQRIATWAYDTQGRVVMNERAGGVEHYEFTYNADGTTTVTDVLGASRTYDFEVINGAMKYVQISGDRCDGCKNADDKQRGYNATGHITSRTNWNGTRTTYVRDATGLELSRTEAVGTPQERTITTEWHPDFRKPLRVSEPERTIEYDYDSAGRLLRRTERAVK